MSNRKTTTMKADMEYAHSSVFKGFENELASSSMDRYYIDEDVLRNTTIRGIINDVFHIDYRDTIHIEEARTGHPFDGRYSLHRWCANLSSYWSVESVRKRIKEVCAKGLEVHSKSCSNYAKFITVDYLSYIDSDIVYYSDNCIVLSNTVDEGTDLNRLEGSVLFVLFDKINSSILPKVIDTGVSNLESKEIEANMLFKALFGDSKCYETLYRIIRSEFKKDSGYRPLDLIEFSKLLTRILDEDTYLDFLELEGKQYKIWEYPSISNGVPQSDKVGHLFSFKEISKSSQIKGNLICGDGNILIGNTNNCSSNCSLSTGTTIYFFEYLEIDTLPKGDLLRWYNVSSFNNVDITAPYRYYWPITITGDCSINAEVPLYLDDRDKSGVVIIQGTGKLTLHALSNQQPCIGTYTNTGCSYGRWQINEYTSLKRLELRGSVTVVCEPGVPNFALGTYGREDVPEIVVGEGCTLIAPEVTGDRVMTEGPKWYSGSTKLDCTIKYNIVKKDGIGADSNDLRDALGELRSMHI